MVTSLIASRDGGSLISAHEGGVIRIWRRRGPADWSLDRELSIDIGDAGIEIDAGQSGFVALVSGSNKLRHWENLSAAAPEVHLLPEEYTAIDSDFKTIALSPDEKWAVLQMFNSRQLMVWI